MQKRKSNRGSWSKVKYDLTSTENSIEVSFQQETVWLSQKQLAVLFGKNKRTISEHIRNILKRAELDRKFSYPEFPDNCH